MLYNTQIHVMISLARSFNIFYKKFCIHFLTIFALFACFISFIVEITKCTMRWFHINALIKSPHKIFLAVLEQLIFCLEKEENLISAHKNFSTTKKWQSRYNRKKDDLQTNSPFHNSCQNNSYNHQNPPYPNNKQVITWIFFRIFFFYKNLFFTLEQNIVKKKILSLISD